MIRIAISPAAFDAISATLPLGSVVTRARPTSGAERLIWLEDAMADRLDAMRWPRESYSDRTPVLRLAATKGHGSDK